MPVQSVKQFSGMAPLVDPLKLADSAAVLADWTKFEGTDVRAWRDPVAIDYDTGAGTDIGSAGGTITKLFRFSVFSDDGSFQARRWLAWATGLRDVHPVASPIPADQYSRLYWTTTTQDMMVASSPTMSQTLGATPGPRVVGIPAPIERPTGTPVDDSATTQRQPAEITNAKPAVVSFPSPDQPFTEGQQVQVVITTPADATAQNMRELSGKSFFVDDVTDNSITLRGSDTTNYSDFVDPSAALVSAVFTDSDFEDRTYVFTLVSDWGEEGPPSPPSDVVTVRRDGGTATITLTWARPNGYDHIVTARVYRTITGTNNTQFFFVKDVALVGGGPSTPVIVQFVDDVDPLEIGELMPSTEWTAPVSGMFGLIGMPNGFFMAGKGNTLHFSEAYQPHAWPDRYRKTLETEFVGAAALGQSAVVATSGKTYLATGSDPASVTLQELPIDAPCLSARSIVSIGHGVVYATYDGLAVITPAGSQIITQSILTKQQWVAIWSNLMCAGFHDGRYIVFAPTGSLKTFSLRIAQDGDLQYATFTGITARACATDTSNDTLCFVGPDGSGAMRRLYRFDGGLGLHAYTWTSKVFTLQAPANFAVAQVFAASYPLTLQIFAAKPTTGGATGPLVSVLTKTVASKDPFRLPSGFTAREWQFTITGTASVQRVDMATSIAELRAL
jgi:hypothetical protein